MRVPTVDLGDPSAPERLDAAFRAMGFAQLRGHGLSHEEVIAPLWAAMDELFSLPAAVKLGYVCDDPLANRGYRARGSEALAYSLGEERLPPDLFESFNIRHEDRSGSRLFARPIWPSEVPGFRVAAERYMREMVRLSAHLDGLIGELIGLPALASRSTRGPDAMACLHYRRAEDELRPAPGQARMGAHSDYTTFTLLCADSVPGLEILLPSGWLPVVPDPGSLLINVGDLLAMWTQDRWPSTVHRVPLLGGGADPERRRSVAYFHYPDLEVAVRPLPRWCDGKPPRYARTTVAEHLEAKLVGPKLHKRSIGETTLGERRLGRS